jgi:protein-S-isoprenylcysteine O-methyltransferase
MRSRERSVGELVAELYAGLLRFVEYSASGSGGCPPGRQSLLRSFLAAAPITGPARLTSRDLRTLGRFYTRILRTAADQQVVQSGPYSVVRHPGYLASLVLWLGFGQCSGTWLVAITIARAICIAYARRIAAEETMLRRTLGSEYEAYAARLSRIVPCVY